MASSLPMTLRLYQRLSAAMVPLTPALIKRRLKQGKEDPARVGERRGVSEDVRPSGPLVWIHGASVGEVLAAAALIERLRMLNMRILLTSGTVTSATIVAKRFPADIIHQYVPYDSPRYVARFLDHWRPSLALFIESDLWPNLILSSAARRLPMVLINGRMSHRSFPRWRRFNGTISALLGRFDVCLAQSQIDAERFAALGSRNVITTGNLKLDVPAPPADAAKLERLMSVTRGRPIIVAASTHPGEEEAAALVHRRLRAKHPNLLTIIAPRHPARSAEIVQLLEAQGLRVVRRSCEERIDRAADVYLADTLGELGLFYRLAGIAFIGGSLAPKGGHNPIEAALLDCAILHGPDMSNTAGAAAALAAAGASIEVDDAEAFAKAVGQLIDDPVERAARAAAAAGIAADNQAVLDAVMKRIAPWLDRLAAYAAKRA